MQKGLCFGIEVIYCIQVHPASPHLTLTRPHLVAFNYQFFLAIIPHSWYNALSSLDIAPYALVAPNNVTL